MTTKNDDVPARRLVHTRRIVCTGYARNDGLFDIEANMLDTKTHDSDLLFKHVQAGQPIHSMTLVVTIDRDLVIQRVEARTEVGPTPYCHEINAAYEGLKGVTIGPGFNREIKRRLGGAQGCTHLSELLGPLATTAIQTLMGLQRKAAPARDPSATRGHPMINTCHAWRQDGEVVAVTRGLRARENHTSAPADGRCEVDSLSDASR
ncbi:hypothetical protein NOV72_01042 [Caballeronia novacaledonica]|uniref:Molybdopterin-guanine dinucleotide biosynthesis protein MobB n=1 Tax=Caballeronia novacaledonica TaxID=1544861 RepID=A0A2U3I102_9BURK|nr:DUF2889 domain-containing protein [Caballeronia novacaledonica]SPB13778.1 hypothetical protein NOV72_01042 [Caballeronia novacaledonica]